MLQDPRRLDPRRIVASVGAPSTSVVEDNANSVRSDFDASSTLVLSQPASTSESISVPLMLKTETDLYLPESSVMSEDGQPILKDELPDMGPQEFIQDKETNIVLDPPPSSICKVENMVTEAAPMDAAMLDEAYSPSSQESDQLLPDISNVESSEIVSTEFSVLPLYIELAEDHQRSLREQALRRIINTCQGLQRTKIKQTQMALIARLFAQVGFEDPSMIFC